jgi:hypothetical protein
VREKGRLLGAAMKREAADWVLRWRWRMDRGGCGEKVRSQLKPEDLLSWVSSGLL